jgi:sarcosine oxidase subunit alpha
VSVRLDVDGRAFECAEGLTVLAALFSAGLVVLRRSPGGEPRGALCGMGTCFECRVAIDGQPHRRACLTPVRDGLRVTTGA